MPRVALPIALVLLSLSGCVSKRAIQQAELAVLQDPGEARGWIALGDLYRRAGEHGQAASAWEQARSLAPGDPELLSRLGGSRGGGIGELERQVLEDPQNDELWGDLGDLYAESGDRVTALKHYRYALRLDPSDGEWQRKVVELIDPAAIPAMLDDLAGSDNDELLGDLADSLREQGQFALACDLYFRALELDPDDGEWTDKAGDCPGGEDLQERLLSTAMNSDNDETIGDAADVHRERGELDQACALYTRAHELDPGDGEWIRQVIDCPEGDAVLDGTLAEAESTRNDEIVGNIADVYRDRGDRDRACALYARAKALDESDSEWQRNLEQCAAGTLAPVGPSTGMIGTLGTASGSGGPAFDQGRAALARGDREAAAEHFEAAMRASPREERPRTALMIASGRSLVDVLEALVADIATDDELWGDLGDARLEAGDVDGAREAYQRAAELDPSDGEWRGKLDLFPR